MWEYSFENGLLAHQPGDCPFGVVVDEDELVRLATRLPEMVSYIVMNRPCLYDPHYERSSCREGRVSEMKAPYVCRS